MIILRFSVQEEYSIERSNGKCHVFKLYYVRERHY